MTEYKDYYKIMGVKRDASQDEIKRAYRKLARRYHPDVSKEADAEARFKEVGEAYEVLKDPQKRAAYDRLGTHWQAGQEFKPPPGWDAGFDFAGGGFTAGDAVNFSDFFESLFGQFGARAGSGRGTIHQIKGEDRQAKVQIGLKEAYQGATHTITFQIPEIDTQGRLFHRQRTLNVHIPKGVKPGQRIRLAGQGAPSLSNGPAGDLYLEIEFKLSSYYSVDGRDVFLQVPVTPWEAALGDKIRVPTPDGDVELKIPAESANGTKLRLRGRGIPGTPRGDIYVVLKIALPPVNSDKAKALYQKMAKELAFNPRSQLRF